VRQRARVLVAIDGPAGAGKSTVARMLAERLGFLLLDTGAMYRAVALAALRAGLGFDEDERVSELAEDVAQRRRLRIEQAGAGSGVRVLLDDEDVSKAIRTPEISMGASRVSALPRVRAALLDLQRQAGERGGVVLEGRDIGTVVFPDARVKLFVTASLAERARRRTLELRGRGIAADQAQVAAELGARDAQDSGRAVAPLAAAADALTLDTTALDAEAAFAAALGLVRRALDA
jgi:cytidylate kinase